MDFFLDVVLPIPIERFFTYRLNKEEASFIKRGMRVAVPFGKSKIYTAIAYQVHENPPEVYEAKEIHQILDDSPIVTEIQLKHWQWIANYYMCTLGEVIKGALPGAFLLESETLVLPNKPEELNESELSDNEFLVLEALRHQSSLKIDEISSIVDRKNVLPLIHQLVKKQAVLLNEKLYEQYRPKMEKYIKLARQYETEANLEELLNTLTRAQKQSQALLSFFQLKLQQKTAIKVNDFVKFSGVSKAVVKALTDKEIFEAYEERTDRVQFEENSKEVHQIVLNELQSKAVTTIKDSFDAYKVCLLHGVTSSGKTEVYIKFIDEVIQSGKQVLYLLPEIALTSQLINRLKAYFGNKVAVYHSKYSLNERVEVWNNVLNKSENAQIVIGARSALFLPYVDLGLVVVDEEHESSFKQFDPAPRYHARDAAIVLANLHNSKCLLGSATPSVETFHNVKLGKYGIAQMLRRYGDVLLPEIELVDIKEATRKKRMKGHFSERLLEEISNCLEEKEQVILFQNRRGFAPIVECSTCGHASQCPNCDVSLTYHQHRNQLRCHYCGYHISLLRSCQACGNSTLDTKGFGTEQIQEELVKLFPNYRIGRMDLDTTRGKYAYEKIINAFETKEERWFELSAKLEG